MLIALIAIVSVMSISITCLILREVITQHEEEIIKVIASEVNDNVQNELLKNVAIAQSMANDLFLHESLKTESSRSEAEQTAIMKKYLTLMRDRVKCSSAFLASEHSKNYWQATGLVKKLDLENDPHDVWYSNIINEDVDYMINVDTDEADNMSLGVFVNTRIRDYDGDLLGICGVGVKMKTLQRIIENDERMYKIKIDVVDRNGLVQIASESGEIENKNLSDLMSYQNSDQLIMNEVDGKYILTKYMPSFDWYLVIQRDTGNMQSTFSNVVFYMSAGFLVALIALLAFVQIFLKRGHREVEESAKKHGIASHAGLYVTMHLIDLKNDVIHELSHNPDINLFFVRDGDSATEKLKRAVTEMTDEESLDKMLGFIDFSTLKDRMNSRHAINQEFLSKNYGWCKAYFMVADLNQIVFAVELIDEEKRREKHLVYLSETDAMTGLKNRGSGEKAIADLIAEGTEGMFCLLDADKFKSINDNYGHAVGDKVIKAIAHCLEKSFRNGDIVMRLGGDEFAAYAVVVTDVEHANIVVNRIFGLIDKIDIPELGDRKISISLGAAIFSASEDVTFTELYKRADAVAYESKKTVGNCATFYKSSDNL
ncbi:MAG: diguanylate cyclase [Selenomonadaceae bacterium]|nr:diguanylate cyclase [Selenomonadaceae bacterium]